MSEKSLQKRQNRLGRRQKAHTSGPSPQADTKQRIAWTNGGRHLPGSQNRHKTSPAGRRK